MHKFQLDQLYLWGKKILRVERSLKFPTGIHNNYDFPVATIISFTYEFTRNIALGGHDACAKLNTIFNVELSLEINYDIVDSFFNTM